MSSDENINSDPVNSTSMSTARDRATESKRPNALFQDPFASVFAGKFNPESMENYPRVDGRAAQLLTTDVAVRTRFYDDLLKKTLVTVKQIVILACGGDFRPYRLSFAKNSPDVEFYLLDMPAVIAYRQKCLKNLESSLTETNCKVIEIACNLANEDWPSKLHQHGFNPNNPTLWLAEGLLPYLTEQENRELFSRIRKLSSKESHIAFDLISTQFQKVLKISPFAVDDEEEVRRIFTEFGCEDIECISFEKLGAMHGRQISHNLTFIVNAKLSNQDFPPKN